MSHRLTKKAFREHLNRMDQEARAARPGQDLRHRHGLYHQRTRLYGDYLYHQDRAMFDVEYEEWKAAALARGTTEVRP